MGSIAAQRGHGTLGIRNSAMSDDWFNKWMLGRGPPLHQRALIVLALLAICVLMALLDNAFR